MKPAEPELAIEFIHANPHPVRNDVHWYRWEFLRRNPMYRADYEKFAEQFGGWLEAKGYWYDDSRRKNWTRAVCFQCLQFGQFRAVLGPVAIGTCNGSCNDGSETDINLLRFLAYSS